MLQHALMKNILPIILLLPLLVANGCRKIGSTGGHYFKCKVNGVVVDFYPETDGIQLYGRNIPDVRFENDFKTLKLRGYDGSNIVVDIWIEDTVNSIGNKTYTLSVNRAGSSFLSVSKSYSNYWTDSVNTGYLTLKINKGNATVKGQFSAKLKHDKSEETIEVTDGSFFLEYD